MKILLIDQDSASRARAATWLEDERHHAVVCASEWPHNWPVVLAEYEPDLVLVPSGSRLQSPDYLLATSSFPDCDFLLFERHADEPPAAYLDSILGGAETAYHQRKISARPFADARRYIIHDDPYMDYASEAKLHSPKNAPGWEEIAIRQEAMFVMQLQMGMADGRHLRAKQYYKVLARFNRGIKCECAYRLGHNSYKVAWLREQLGRWMTVIAHYIPDTEVEHCPPPQNASSGFAFLHYEMPTVFLYPIGCVLLYGIRAGLAAQIQDAAAWRYDGEDETQLAARGCSLFGLNAYLAEVARAQVWVMEQFMSPTSEFHVETADSRSLRRTMGTYFEFWGWDYLWNMGKNLRQITTRVQSGETRVERSVGSKMVPTFCEFRDAAVTELSRISESDTHGEPPS